MTRGRRRREAFEDGPATSRGSKDVGLHARLAVSQDEGKELQGGKAQIEAAVGCKEGEEGVQGWRRLQELVEGQGDRRGRRLFLAKADTRRGLRRSSRLCRRANGQERLDECTQHVVIGVVLGGMDEKVEQFLASMGGHFLGVILCESFEREDGTTTFLCRVRGSAIALAVASLAATTALARLQSSSERCDGLHQRRVR